MNLWKFIVSINCKETASLQYFDPQGHDLTQPLNHRNFIVFFSHNDQKFYFRSFENPYYTNLLVFEDPCESKIRGLFNSAKGIYNSCNKKLDFVLGNSYYSMDISKQKDNLEILPINSVPSQLKDKVLTESESYSDSSDIGADTGEELNINPNMNNFRLKVFVFNNEFRTKRLGIEINRNTYEIFEQVNLIFKDSNIPLTIEISGILNYENDENLVESNKTLLHSFKDLIEPTRFNRFNYQKPLAKSDLVLLIYEKRNKIYLNSNLSVHGMTFQGGSSRLDSSYSMVITTKDNSKYFVAKKIAHEIGHSLNAMHTQDESVMEKTTCKDCEEEKRLFSENSKNQIMKFLNKNHRIFSKKIHKKHSDDEVLKTKTDANDYAIERRKHTFQDIVKTRLHNRKPSMMIDGPNPLFILFLYSILLIMVFYYWK